MEINDYIAKQMKEHKNYANSFKTSPLTNSNEQIHPKTGKVITWWESNYLIEKDAQNRAKRIVKKLQK